MHIDKHKYQFMHEREQKWNESSPPNKITNQNSIIKIVVEEENMQSKQE